MIAGLTRTRAHCKCRGFLFCIMACLMCALNFNLLRIRHRSDDNSSIFLTHLNSNRAPQQHLVKRSSSSGFLLTKEAGNSTTGINSLHSISNTIHNVTTIAQARQYQLAQLPPKSIHTAKYTIRMNTWQRNEQLLLSVNHHATCEGVASIQIIWCDEENNPPDEISNHTSGKVVIEYHEINSMNERYRILIPAPTMAVLNLDDDILRPCEALDAAFVRWTRHPDRIVGFYVRSHLNLTNPFNYHNTTWQYSFLKQFNLYSIALPSKSSFIHRDYLDLYIATMPWPIYEHINTNFNCEDIAMSYFVSTLTDGKPPLLGDHWTVDSQLQMHIKNGLSWRNDHMSLRNSCVNDFAELLGLKEGKNATPGLEIRPLQFGTAKHNQTSCFGYGDEPECWSDIDSQSFSHAPRLRKLIDDLKLRESLPGGEDAKVNVEWFANMKAEMEAKPKEAGLVKLTGCDESNALC